MLILLGISEIALCPAADIVFRRSRIFTINENQDTEIILTLSDNAIAIQSLKAGGGPREIPYSSIIRMRYESGKHHRYVQGMAMGAVSLGLGAIVAGTKETEHWLAIDFRERTNQSVVILRLDKKEYRDVTSSLTAKTGMPVELLDAKTDSLDPTMASLDVDETVAFSVEKVAVAVKNAMDRTGCTVQKEARPASSASGITNSSLTGPGGEIVIASLSAKGAGTQVRIVSKRAAVRHRNWSTPIYEGMKAELETSQ